MQRTVLIVALVVVIGLIAVLLSSALGLFPGEDDAAAGEVSQEAANSAEEKLAGLAAGEGEARLSAVELTSLFHYRPDVWSLRPLHAPVVEMARDSVQVSGRVAADELPEGLEIGSLRALLPDTAEVEIAGTFRSDRVAGTVIEIGSVEVAGMPIPARLYSRFFETNTMTLPLPSGIGSARVEGGELVLTP